MTEDPANIPLPTSSPTNEYPQQLTNAHSPPSNMQEQDEEEMQDVPLNADEQKLEPEIVAANGHDDPPYLEQDAPATREAELPSIPPEHTDSHSESNNSADHVQVPTGIPLPSVPSFDKSQPPRSSLTLTRGNTVSIILITSALETIAASREAKRSAALRDGTKSALEHIRSNEAVDARLIFEPLKLACETKNEKLMIASLDCISKLISYSFFAEPDNLSHPFPSPPPSPRGPNAMSPPEGANAPQPALVDLVAHTITACHSETTPDAVSLQIVKALLSLVLSPTTLVHHSSLLKAVRTVYNVFLLSNDPVNQMVAQGGLTQMVHHVFTRCKISIATVKTPMDSNYPAANGDHRKSDSFSIPTPVSVNGQKENGKAGTHSDSSISLPLPVAEGELQPEPQTEASPQTAVTL